MKPWKLEELNPELRARVKAAMGIAPTVEKEAPRKRRRSEPNKTEAEYNRLYLNGSGVYEGMSFKLPGGSRYTPDWIRWHNGKMEAHEVKGSYRHHSHARSKTAFREAVAAFPEVRFFWATKGKHRWEVEEYA